MFVVFLFSGMANRAVLQLCSSLPSAASVPEPLGDAVWLWAVQLLFVAEGNVSIRLEGVRYLCLEAQQREGLWLQSVEEAGG